METFGVKIAIPEKIDEVLEADVVVVGLGIAGIACAAKAAVDGAKTIAIDVAPSVEVINATRTYGSCTIESEYQKKYEGYVTKDQFFQHMYYGTYQQENAGLLSHMIDVSPDVLELLEGLGMEYFWEKPELIENPKAIDRIHDRIGWAYTLEGPARGRQFQAMLDKAGATTMWGTRAVALDIADDGSVVGIYAEDLDGKTYHIKAKGGVCLCCGGFIKNAEMLQHYIGCEAMSLTSSVADGSGILLAQSAGAQIGKNFALNIYEFSAQHPKDSQSKLMDANDVMYMERLGSLVVDRIGRRFMNESWMATRTMFCTEPQARVGGRYYMISDDKLIKDMQSKTLDEILGEGILDPSFDVSSGVVAPMTFPDIYDDIELGMKEGFIWKADTLEELAEKTGLVDLPETVAAYNGYCEKGVDEEMHKPSVFLRPVEQGPFYAIECISTSMMTLGGIKTDRNSNAVDPGCAPIPGLYSCGADCDAWSVPYYEMTTTSLFEAATGYIAAEHAAKRAKEA